MERQPCVYMLASRHGTLYTGVTSNLLQRLHRHREGDTKGFATEHCVWRLVHFEQLADMPAAIAREKQLKNWKRDWKVQLIERDKLFSEDLAIGLGFNPLPPHRPLARSQFSKPRL